MKNFLSFYEKWRMRIQQQAETMTIAGSEHAIVVDAIQRLNKLNQDGKRLRGILVYIGYALAGQSKYEEADALAQAFEMFQTSILVHDDVFDHAESRRGRATLHVQFLNRFIEEQVKDVEYVNNAREIANSSAVCVGDYGLYMAEQILVDAYQNHPRFGKLLKFYHNMLMKTIQGETLDVQLPFIEKYGLWKQYGITENDLTDTILEIYHLKTSCYTIIGPLCSGMLLGGASQETMRQIEDVADDLGIAFQLQDDVLGVFGDATGKDVGSDISEFKQTMLYAYVRKDGGAPYEELLKYYGKKQLSELEVGRVKKIFRETGALDYVEKTAAKYYRQAMDKLEQIIGVSKVGRELLRGFILYLEDRKK